MSKLTISIVNYNAGDYLIKCLKSLEKFSSEIDPKVIVVDNASTDGSVQNIQKLFPKINFILNEENLGFGKANNQVLKNAETEYVLTLNPDTELKAGVLKELILFMDQNPDVGVVTCKVVLKNGKLDWATHRGFPTPIASLLYFLGNDSLYHLSRKNLSEIHEVDAVSGAFLLTRKCILDKVGFFDEDYFMYAEDIDLCYRIKKAGYKIIYYPKVEIIHNKGISSGLKKHSQGSTTASKETKLRSLNAFYETMKIFYKKHYEDSYPFFVNWFIYGVINLKWWLAKRKLTV